MKAVKAIISVIIMIIISPLIVIVVLAVLNPTEFGEVINIQTVLTVYMFAIITVPLWVTYIPFIVLIPIIMQIIAKREAFHELQIIKFVMLSSTIGSICGVLVLSPVLFLVAADSDPLILSWVLAGAASGAITSTVITLTYRVSNLISPDKI